MLGISFREIKDKIMIRNQPDIQNDLQYVIYC